RMQGFDYFNIRISDLSGVLDELYCSADSISGSLEALTAKDHSGFQLSRVEADFVYSDTGAGISNLLAETPNTTIREYLKVTYPPLEAISNKPEPPQVDGRI